MANGQLISFWSSTSASGRRTLATALAERWTSEGRDVILVMPAPSDSHGAAAEWIPRFKPLSSKLLRNYLKAGIGTLTRLTFHTWPDDSQSADLFTLLRKAFDRVIVISPTRALEQTTPLLDASEALFWMTIPDPAAPEHFRAFLEDLSRAHFPHTYVHAILNKVPTASLSHAVEPLNNKSYLARIPLREKDDFVFREAVTKFSHALDTPALYKPTTISSKPSEDLIEEIRQRVQPQLLKALEDKTYLEPSVAQQAVESCVAEDASLPASREVRGEILSRVMNEVLGLGPLEPLLKDPTVSEIMVNGKGHVFVERHGKLFSTSAAFSSENQLRAVIDRIVAPIGRRVDESMPLCDARLPDGSRVNIVLPPLALDGPVVTIRKFMAHRLSFQNLIEYGSLSAPMAEFLTKAVAGRKNIVVSGGTGSGKTTLLNALSSAIPDDERIVTIEDAAELRLQKPHVVRLESRSPNAEGEGAIPIRRLVMNALRMRPDRIVVGECRGGEALDMLQAMNTGHDGSLTTLHANTPRDALGRLETLVLMAGMDLPIRVVREQIRSAVHLIVQQTRLGNGERKVTSITEVTGMEGDVLTTQEIFSYSSGQFKATGMVSSFRAA